jgi:hypothetical protein
VQPSQLPDLEADPDEGGLGPADAVNIWRGVLITAERTFQPDDDVCKLLRMLAKVPGVLDGSDGSRWPMGRLVTILNAEFSPPSWSDDRVENGKKASAELGSTIDAPEWPRRYGSRGGFCASCTTAGPTTEDARDGLQRG